MPTLSYKVMNFLKNENLQPEKKNRWDERFVVICMWELHSIPTSGIM